MPIDPDILGRLMIDRHVNQLSADVGALLDAYIVQNDKSRQLAKEINATVSLARKAVIDGIIKDEPALPPLRKQSQFHITAGGRVRQYVHAALSAAACLVMGLCLGLWISKPDENQMNAVLSAPPSQMAVQSADFNEHERYGRFLSLHRLYLEAMQIKPRRADDVSWNSPLTITIPIPQKG